jgi:signal transduction histidine kinase
MEIVEQPAQPCDGGDVTAKPLSELVERLTTATTPEATCEAALDALTAALDLDASAVVLQADRADADPARPARCRATRKLSDGARDELESPAAAWRVAAGEGRRPAVFEDLTAADGQALRPLFESDGVASAAFVPIVHGGRVAGWLALFSQRTRRFAPQDLLVAELAAGLVGKSLAMHELRVSELRLHAAGERSADRVRRLTRVSGSLSSAPTATDVATMIIKEAHEALEADWSGVWLLDASGARLTAVATRGMPDAMRPSCQSFAASDTSNPLCLSVANNEALWLENWQAFARRFPTSEQRVRTKQAVQVAFACLPLRIEEKTIGGMVLSFLKDRAFDTDERDIMGLFAQHCAQGIERARLYDQALEAVQAREDFLSVAGHELRTPLSTLLLQTELQIETAQDLPTARRRFAPMQRTLRRLIKLADDVLDVARIRAGRLRLEPEPLELCALVRDVATRTALALQLPEAHLRITAADPIEGRWDPMRMEQVVVNLITNACKYGGGKPITVQVSAADPACAELRVLDQGIGIAMEDQARIFERFARSADSREFAGLGLGLWIVREIVAAHRGTITVTSQPGAGAEFCVRLPLDGPADAARAE